jgi:cell division protein FtsQ
MDRSLVARRWPFTTAAPRRGASSSRRGRKSPASRRQRLLGQAGARIGDLARGGFTAIWERRRARLALIATLALVPLLGGGWFGLRDSSLSSVEHVRISGVGGPHAGAVEDALRGAARGMSTMNVDVGKLRAAVAPLRVVSGLRVAAHFPHSLTISVIEQLPVAALVTVGGQTAVAANGVVLGPALLSSGLPVVHGATIPASGRIAQPGVRAELTVLGAAPAALVSHISRAFSGPMGLTVLMTNGLRIYFGDTSRPHAKWAAAARVLADPSSAGAWYVDVRLPERPAAGLSGPAAATAAATATSTAAGSSDPSAAAIAQSLAQAVNGTGGSTSAPAVTPGSVSPSTSTTSPTSAGGASPAASGAPTSTSTPSSGTSAGGAPMPSSGAPSSGAGSGVTGGGGTPSGGAGASVGGSAPSAAGAAVSPVTGAVSPTGGG